MRCIVLLIGVIFLTSCNEESHDVSGNSMGTVGMSLARTLAEVRLQEIVKNEGALFEGLGDEVRELTGDEERRVVEISDQYRNYLIDNPADVYGWILYGKFLRKVGEDVEALKVFMEANRLDGGIAVVKQQIGNLLAEKGEYQLARGYFLNAIGLEPEVALYHYQLGELLSHYKELILSDKEMSVEVLDGQIQGAFEEAKRLSPERWEYQMRYGESFYDVDHADWGKALTHWESLVGPDNEAKELLHLHRARVLIEMGDDLSANRYLGKVFMPKFEKSRQELMNRIKEKASL